MPVRGAGRVDQLMQDRAGGRSAHPRVPGPEYPRVRPPVPHGAGGVRPPPIHVTARAILNPPARRNRWALARSACDDPDGHVVGDALLNAYLQFAFAPAGQALHGLERMPDQFAKRPSRAVALHDPGAVPERGQDEVTGCRGPRGRQRGLIPAAGRAQNSSQPSPALGRERCTVRDHQPAVRLRDVVRCTCVPKGVRGSA